MKNKVLSTTEQLLRAVGLGKITAIRKALSDGADINAHRAGGETALHLAARLGPVKICQILIDAGARIDAVTDAEETPLHMAARSDRAEACRLLLENGAKITAKTREGFSPLHSSAQTARDGQACQYLLAAGAKLDARDNRGYTALHHAVAHENKAVCKILVDAGLSPSDPGTGSRNEWLTPFQLSLTMYFPLSLEVATYFAFDCGEDLDQRTQSGKTLLELVGRNSEILQSLYAFEKNPSKRQKSQREIDLKRLRFKFIEDARSGNLDVCREMLASNEDLDINFANSVGNTALHAAAARGHVDLCQMLVSLGAQVNKQNNNGETALHSAYINGRIAVLDALLGVGADLEAGDIRGYTVLHMAALSTDTAGISMLLDRGANLEARSKSGGTPLHAAALVTETDACTYLIEAGANVLARGDNDHTVLHTAASNDCVEVCRFLISKGISPSEPPTKADRRYQTPFQFAVASNAENVVKYFVLECGEDISQRAADGSTMIKLASKYSSMQNTIHALTTELAVQDALSAMNIPSAPRKSSGMEVL